MKKVILFPKRRLLYALVITVIAVVIGYTGVLPVFRGHLKEYLGIGDAGFGLLFSIGSLPSLISILLGGQLIDRWGPRRVIRVCIIGVGCAMLAVALGGQRFWIFLLAALLAGTFQGPLFIAISAYLGKLFPNHQRRVISLNLASASLGGMMFPLVAEGLLTLANRYPGIDFRHILHVPFFLSGVLLFSLSFIYRKRLTVSGRRLAGKKMGDRRPWGWRDLLLPRRSLALAALISLHGAVDSSLNIWMARFLESASFPHHPVAPGLVLSGYSLAYLLSRGLLAMLPDSWGRRVLLIAPGMLGGAVFIAGLLSRSYIWTATAYVLGALCWSCEYPAIVSTLMRHDRRRFGAAMAMAGVITSIGMIIILNAMGLMTQRIGEEHMWKGMLMLACGFPIVGIGAWVWTWKTGVHA